MNSDLTKIPYIGKITAQYLANAGFPDIESLKGQDPQMVYLQDCLAQGEQINRCALYIYRLAVCYADNDGVLPPDKQHWWNFKD